MLSHAEEHFDVKLNRYMFTQDYIDMFMQLGTKFEKYRKLKEKYLEFNQLSVISQDNIESRFMSIIKEYENSNEDIFIDFAKLLWNYTK